MKTKNFCFTIFVFMLFATASENAIAQFHAMKFDYLTVDNGLSNNRVQCVLRDSKGFLWIGTSNGLNKFDGQKIIIYKNNQLQNNSISSNNIQCIYEDRKHNLWIGTASGINCYNRETESFKRFTSDRKDVTVNSIEFGRDNSIFTINEDKLGNIWCSTQNGLKVLYTEKSIFNIYDLPVRIKNFQSYQPITFCIDYFGNFWLGSQDNKLWRFNPNSLKFDSFSDNLFNSTLHYNKVLAIDSTGTIWVGTQGDGLYSFDSKKQKFHHYSTSGDGVGTHGNLIKGLYVCDSRYLYVAIDLGGINRFDLQKKVFEYCLMNDGQEHGLNSDAIWAVCKDNEDILYFGTSVSGVNIYNPKRARFQTYRNEADNLNSLVFNVVFKFFEDSKGLIWIGTDGGGLSVFDPVSKTFKNYKHNPKDPYSLNGNAVNAFTEDKNHDIWLGGWGAGLSRFERNTGKFYHYMPDNNNPNAISDLNIWDLMTDSIGNIWISYNYFGTDLFDIQKGVIKRYRQNSSDPNLYCPSMTNRFILQRDGKMGFATQNGYYILDRSTNKIENSGLFDQFEMCDIYLDKNNNYWGATVNNGLFLSKPDGTIEKFDESNGFPSNSISGFLEDSNENIWILTSNGLTEYIVKSKKFRNFTALDGLQGNQFMFYAHLKAKDGNFYIGGYNGFNVFRPEDIKINPYIPKVYIDEFQIFNEPVTIYSKNSPLKQTISETKEIILSYKQSVFSFGFTAINFTYPEKAIYAYKMKGYDKKWNYTNASRRYTTYTNLDPGEYTFMVKATNNDAIWNETPTSIKIIITPPFWGTWWFKSLLILLIVGSAISFYKIRIRQYKNKKRLLEQKVKERTSELQATNLILKENQEEILNQNEAILKQRNVLELKNKELEDKNLEIINITGQLHDADQLKLRFFTNISHDLRTPLTLILGSLESVISGIENNKVLIDRLKIIMSNAQRLYRLVNQLLDFRKIDTETLKLQPEFSDVIIFIRNVYDAFRHTAENRMIEYAMISKYDSYNTWFDPDKLDKILYNLLSNAFKFTPDSGKIILEIDFIINKLQNNHVSESIIIKVIDSGMGIHESDLSKIFDRFYQAEHSYSRKYQGSGIGLALTKHLVEIHHGTITVKSELGEGACFEVKLSIGNSLQVSNSETIETSIITHSKTIQTTKTKSIAEKKSETINEATILIVEDNDDLRRFIRDEISAKFRVIEARNGKQGFELALSEIPDLVISDVMMPLMDGFELCVKLKFEWKTSHIPIIILTAKADEESLYYGLEIGADAYMGKPFMMKHLLIQIDNLLANRRKLIDKYNVRPLVELESLTINSADKNFIRKIYSLIDNHLADNSFGVEILADEMNMSRSQLYKKIFSILNMSPGELIRELRLKKASTLLYEQKLAVSDVALMVGFADRPQFSRSFTNLFGISPKQFQLQCIEKGSALLKDDRDIEMLNL